LLASAGAAALALSGNSLALPASGSTSTSFFKSVQTGQDLVCQAADGEIVIDATPEQNSDPTTIRFLMESVKDGTTITSHTCCEVPHYDPNDPSSVKYSVADCENDPSLPCTCGEFVLDQKVEQPDPTLEKWYTDTDGIYEPGDETASNCLTETTTTSGAITRERYRCVVSKGSPKAHWVWHLKKVMDSTYTAFCQNNASNCSACGVAMGTPDNPKPQDFPDGVWQYDLYKKDGKEVLATFDGNWCHTGSFCLDDAITCDAKKLDLRTASTADYALVDVDTVQTFNGNSTSGNVPTDFLSTADAGTLLVDPTEINFGLLTVNDEPVSASISNTGDRNGDGFDDVRVNISQADFKQALYPTGECVSDSSKAVVFRGVFNDGRAWVGPTTVNVVCN